MLRRAECGACLVPRRLLRAAQRAVRDLLGCKQSLMAACISSGSAEHTACRSCARSTFAIARRGLTWAVLRGTSHPNICLLCGSCATCGCGWGAGGSTSCMEGCCAAQAAAQADGLLGGPLCAPLFSWFAGMSSLKVGRVVVYSRGGCNAVLIIECVQGLCWG